MAMNTTPITIQSHRGPYVVRFAERAFDGLAQAGDGRPCHYIVDRRVHDLWRERLDEELAGKPIVFIDADEQAKTLDRMPEYAQALVAQGVRRSHKLIAVGGGVVQDITCFLASTLLRGIDWEFYPTTLLAQADSCIGSKSSINVGTVKNLMGTFYPPRAITIAPKVLSTLSEGDLLSGIGEMIKVHVIDGPAAFDALAAAHDKLRPGTAEMLHFVRQSLEIKRRLIEADEFDRGPRLVMNYGHSFGHAIESATEFGMPHGIAVTLGMDMANYTAFRLGRLPEADFRRMHPLMVANSRGFEAVTIPLDRFLAAIGKDKKNEGQSLTLILPGADSRVEIVKVANDAVFADICRDWLETVRP